MDPRDLIKALQNTLRGGGPPHMRVLATRSGRLDQPPANDARGLDPRDRLLRPVQRAEHRLLDQLTAAVIVGRYGLGAHDPLGQVPRRQRVRGVAKFVIDPPKTLALAEPGTRARRCLARIS